MCQACEIGDLEDELMDPVEVGMRMPFAIMKAVQDAGIAGADLVTFGMMMDVAIGSCQVSAVEKGIDVVAYRAKIQNTLERLKLMAVKK